ncbi:hypothetical protein F5X98DRAFT_271779 [Xylaria grammica]|nr:hypothetical protein F5X98DRAFT_271779 [Xylaria grammica]
MYRRSRQDTLHAILSSSSSNRTPSNGMLRTRQVESKKNHFFNTSTYHTTYSTPMVLLICIQLIVGGMHGRTWHFCLVQYCLYILCICRVGGLEEGDTSTLGFEVA